jgi:hypothetical protein
MRSGAAVLAMRTAQFTTSHRSKARSLEGYVLLTKSVHHIVQGQCREEEYGDERVALSVRTPAGTRANGSFLLPLVC